MRDFASSETTCTQLVTMKPPLLRPAYQLAATAKESVPHALFRSCLSIKQVETAEEVLTTRNPRSDRRVLRRGNHRGEHAAHQGAAEAGHPGHVRGVRCAPGLGSEALSRRIVGCRRAGGLLSAADEDIPVRLLQLFPLPRVVRGARFQPAHVVQASVFGGRLARVRHLLLPRYGLVGTLRNHAQFGEHGRRASWGTRWRFAPAEEGRRGRAARPLLGRRVQARTLPPDPSRRAGDGGPVCRGGASGHGIQHQREREA